MNASLCLLGYAAVLTFLGPRILLGRTSSGASPRLAVVVWLSAMTLAVAAWLVAGAGVAAGFLHHHATASARYCADVLLVLHRGGWAGHAVPVAAIAVAAVSSIVVLSRLGLALHRFWGRSREHASAARIVGARSGHDGVVVVRAHRPAAYCVAGRPDAIVVTSAAVDALPPEQLAAVVAHERAHLRGRHPQLMMLLRACAAAMPRLPLFRSARTAVGELLEMCADDEATRGHGRAALLSGLIALAEGPRLPGAAMGVADVAVRRRALRLAVPAGAGERLRQRVVLGSTLTAMICLPAALTAICHL